jgi:hypothetical protein
MLNHPNFMLPEDNLASPEFGQILQAAGHAFCSLR